MLQEAPECPLLNAVNSRASKQEVFFCFPHATCLAFAVVVVLAGGTAASNGGQPCQVSMARRPGQAVCSMAAQYMMRKEAVRVKSDSAAASNKRVHADTANQRGDIGPRTTRETSRHWPSHNQRDHADTAQNSKLKLKTSLYSASFRDG